MTKKDYHLMAKTLGALIINKKDIVKKQNKNLWVKKEIFNDYFEDNTLLVYIEGQKSFDVYQVMYHTENEVVLAYLWEKELIYIPTDFDISC